MQCACNNGLRYYHLLKPVDEAKQDATAVEGKDISLPLSRRARIVRLKSSVSCDKHISLEVVGTNETKVLVVNARIALKSSLLSHLVGVMLEYRGYLRGSTSTEKVVSSNDWRRE